MKVSIAKALKIKARLAGEVNRLRNVVRESNMTCASARPDAVDTPEKLEAFVKGMRRTDVAATLGRLSETVERLIAVKTAIARGNAEAQGILVRLAEAKGEAEWIGYVHSAPDAVVPMEGGIVQVQDSAIKPDAIEKMREACVKRIENLQDEIDEYNATHFVEIPD